MLTLVEALAANMPIPHLLDRREDSMVCVWRWDGQIVQFIEVSNYYVARHDQSWLAIKRELEQNVLDIVTSNGI